MILTAEAFLQLRHSLPVADVRSEAEFASGHIPGSANIPLLNNAHRAAVGIAYKMHGQLEAIRTGFQLAGPELRQIIERTEELAGPARELIAYCWRGGMRSDYFSRFAGMARITCHTLAGGYKAYRRLAHEAFSRKRHLIIIGGYTGCGKTEILQTLKRLGEQVIDLEALACHKGSVFGGLMMPTQPTSEQFENNIYEELLRLDANQIIWMEDESVAIGKVFLPQALWKQMCESPLVEIQADTPIRINRLVQEYAQSDVQLFLRALDSIVSRLGHQRYEEARRNVLAGNWHEAIHQILTYYDKAYRNGLERKQHRVAARFTWDGTNPVALATELIAFRKQIVPTPA